MPRTIACWHFHGDYKNKRFPLSILLSFVHCHSSLSTSPVSIYLVSERRKTGSSSLHTSIFFYRLKCTLALEWEEGCRGRRNQILCTNEGENEEGIFIILSCYTHSMLSFSLLIKDVRQGSPQHTLKRSLKVGIMFYPSSSVFSE